VKLLLLSANSMSVKIQSVQLQWTQLTD